MQIHAAKTILMFNPLSSFNCYCFNFYICQVGNVLFTADFAANLEGWKITQIKVKESVADSTHMPLLFTVSFHLFLIK